MGLTVAFPHGWIVNNLRDRLLVYTKKKDALLQMTIEKRPEKQSPREFLLAKLKGGSFCARRRYLSRRHGRLYADHAIRLAARQR